MDRKETYRLLNAQVRSLIDGEQDQTANLANIVAAIKQNFNFFWIGFYLVKQNELVLGPFQGPIACTRIGFDKGVCGSSWSKKKTLLVEDVHAFPGHIACSADSMSEIVVPIIVNDQVVMVLDIDSDRKAEFDKTDQLGLEETGAIIAEAFHSWT